MALHRRHVRWIVPVLGVGLAGCGDPPPMITLAPPGLQQEIRPLNLDDDGIRAQAVGEQSVAQSRAAGQRSEMAGLEDLNREPTAAGEQAETEEGLTYETIKPGDPDGRTAKFGDTILVRYTGTLEDGSIFDSTRSRGDAPATLNLIPGPTGVIGGWLRGIPGMKVGEVRKLVIPPDLAYGASGRPGIPPNSTLIFEIELVEIR